MADHGILERLIINNFYFLEWYACHERTHYFYIFLFWGGCDNHKRTVVE